MFIIAGSSSLDSSSKSSGYIRLDFERFDSTRSANGTLPKHPQK